MSPEPPSRPARRARPDADFRRRALGIADAGGGPAPTAPPSFQSALARIPDLERGPDGTPLVVPVPAAGDAAPPRRAPDTGAPELGAPVTDPTMAVSALAPAAPAPADTPAPTDSPAPAAADPAAPVPTVDRIAPIPAPPGSTEGSGAGGRKPTRAVEIPVLEGTTVAPSGASVAAPVTPAAVAAAALATSSGASATSAPDTEVRRGPNVPAPPPEVALDHHGSRISPPPHPPWWRRAAFGVAVVVLVAAIPVLGRTGYRLVTGSTDGRVGAAGAGRDDPGYEEEVTSTPTAVVVQKDATGMPVGLTFLSLSNGDAGGSVVFVPLDTEVREPAYGVDRLRSSYTVVADDPAGATNQIADQTGKALNVGIDEVIALDDRGWEQLVSPVGPLHFDNPEPVDLPTGTVPNGETELAPGQVGPYLATHKPGEDEAAAFYRQELVWKAWFDAIKASGNPDVVPGETETGIGRFVRTLAAGPVSFQTVPGSYQVGTDGVTRFEPDSGALSDLMSEVVPAPDSPFPGARTTVRVLNGVSADPIPPEILSDIVGLNGSVVVVGNGPSFGQAETTMVFADPAKEDYAQLLKARLGATGSTKHDPAALDTVDITVVLGRDVLGDLPAPDSTSTAPTTATVPAPASSEGGP